MNYDDDYDEPMTEQELAMDSYMDALIHARDGKEVPIPDGLDEGMAALTREMRAFGKSFDPPPGALERGLLRLHQFQADTKALKGQRTYTDDLNDKALSDFRTK